MYVYTIGNLLLTLEYFTCFTIRTSFVERYFVMTPFEEERAYPVVLYTCRWVGGSVGQSVTISITNSDLNSIY